MSDSGHTHLTVHRPYWEARCRRLAARLFAGQVLEVLGPSLLVGSTLTACAVLLARLQVLPVAFGGSYAWAPLAVSALVAVVLASRRGWPRRSAVRVRLEEAYRLHNRLSAATEGAIEFPPPPGHAGGPTESARIVAWRWSQILPLPAASLGLLLIAVFVPTHATTPVKPGVTQKPPPLERLEEMISQLTPARTVDEATLEALQSQIDQLTQRDPEEWYSHASLEAAESLLHQTESGLGELATHMSAAARALDQMANAHAGTAGASEGAGSLEAAMHGIEHGRMPGAGDVTQSLRNASGRQLDPEAARKLADALRKNSDFLQQLAQSTQSGQMQFTQLGAGSTPGNPGGKDGEGPGQGGVDRGPGTAPLTIAQNPSTAEPGAEGALSAFDPERAALGDAAGQSVGEHEIDREAAERTAAGGAVVQPGSGGEAAWTQRLTPEERRAVKRTFE